MLDHQNDRSSQKPSPKFPNPSNRTGMKLHTLLLPCSMLICTNTFAQTDILQDDDGKSSLSILAKDSSSHPLNINAVDKSIAFALSKNNVKRDFFIGGGQLKVSG